MWIWNQNVLIFDWIPKKKHTCRQIPNATDRLEKCRHRPSYLQRSKLAQILWYDEWKVSCANTLHQSSQQPHGVIAPNSNEDPLDQYWQSKHNVVEDDRLDPSVLLNCRKQDRNERTKAKSDVDKQVYSVIDSHFRHQWFFSILFRIFYQKMCNRIRQCWPGTDSPSKLNWTNTKYKRCNQNIRSVYMRGIIILFSRINDILMIWFWLVPCGHSNRVD